MIDSNPRPSELPVLQQRQILNEQEHRETTIEAKMDQPQTENEILNPVLNDEQLQLSYAKKEIPGESKQSITSQSQPASQPVKINRVKEFVKVREIGSGAYGTVSLVRKGDVYYAMKKVSSSQLKKDRKTHQIYMERVIRHFKFAGIPEFYSCFSQENYFYYVMAYAEGGQLSALINKHYTKLSEDFVRFYVAEMVLMLEYMHSRGFSHRDFKPENLVLTSSGHLQVIDFGTLNDFCEVLIPPGALQEVQLKNKERRLRITDDKLREKSKNQEERDSDQKPELNQQDKEDIEARLRSSTFCGTAEYLCPEMFEEEICEMNGDLWALGCMIFKFFTNKTPFFDSIDFQIFDKIKKGTFNKSHELIPPLAQDLINKLLVVDQEARLASIKTKDIRSADDVYSAYKKLKDHEFFKGIDFEHLYQNDPPKFVLDFLQKIKNPSQDKQSFNNSQYIDNDQDSDEEIKIMSNYNDNDASEELQRNAKSLSPAKARKVPQQVDSDGESENRSTQVPMVQMFRRFPQPYTQDKVVYSQQIVKVNKKAWIFTTKRARQILLFDVKPPTIIYYMPFKKVPTINYIIVKDTTVFQLNSPQRITFKGENNEELVFEQPKSEAPALLNAAILKLFRDQQQQQIS